MRSIRLAAAIVLTAVLLAGCGSGPKKHETTGSVSADGQPVAKGIITFFPADTGDDAGPAESAIISQGAFSVEMHSGKKRVEITATREVPGKTEIGAAGEKIPVTEQFLPAKYNEQTELTAEIKADGPNELKFDLQTK